VYVERNVEACLVQPLLEWKSNTNYIFWACICSLRYPACKARESYYIGRPLYVACLAVLIFLNYLINVMI
jgi:hypothetical protein